MEAPIYVKPIVIPEILLDMFYNGNYLCTVNEFSHLDARRQICERHLEGYSFMINSNYWDLFDKELDIRSFIVRITPDGEIEDEWFPGYRMKEYGYVGVFSETLEVVKKIRVFQREKNNTGE
jgi:hypothetical protein